MTTLSERLAELSGEATPGAFRQGTDPANSYRIYANIGRVAEVICGESRANEATAALIVELVNAYRAGRLIVKED